MIGWITMKLGMSVGLGPGHIVLDWDPAELPSPKGGGAPQFSTHICCGQMAGWIKMPLGRQVGLSQSDIVLAGDPAPLPKTGAEPPIFGRVYCSQTAGWIKMPLGVEVGLGPGDFVLDGDPAPLPKKGTAPLPNFQPMSIVAKRLDGSRWHLASWHRGGPWSRLHCARLGLSSPPPKWGRSPLPIFGLFLSWPNG